MVEDRRNGKSPDVGTINLVAAERNQDGRRVLRLRRNAFIEIPADARTRTLVTQMRAPHVIHGPKMYVLGDSAFELAEALGAGVPGPAASPRKAHPLPAMKTLLGSIADSPVDGGAECVSAISSDHAAPTVLQHETLFDALLHTLSRKPSHIVEGQAVPFSLPADEDFAGIGIFCGGGLFDLCVAYKTLPAIFFSTSHGGEWMDLEDATELGVKSAWGRKARKNGNGHAGPENGEDNEIAGYYRNLVNNTLGNIKGQLRPASELQEFPDPISIVFSGATSMTGNFIELVRTVYRDEAPAASKPAEPRESKKKDATSPALAVARLAALKSGVPQPKAAESPKPAARKAEPAPAPKPAEAWRPQLSGAAAPAKSPTPAPEMSDEDADSIDLTDVAMQLETAPPVDGLHGAPDRRLIDFRRYLPVSGRGLDVGTSNVVGAVRAFTGATPCNIQRNAFLDVRSDTFTEKLLLKLGVDRYDLGSKRFVIGNPAFEFANIFEKSTRRPMKNGVMSPSEPDAIHVESLVIRSVLGRAAAEGEICAYSMQADPIDVERNGVYHSGAIETILRGLGYSPRPVLEGQAVVYAELADEDYTGIGISCGGGTFNICISYKSLPALAFSISRGGDWIDANVAQSLGLPSSQVCAIKEGGVDLNHPAGRVEDAICIYYRNLIHYSIETMRERFEVATNMPSFRAPISVVCSGGTSMIKGFIDVFRDEFNSINFPIAVKEIRRAKDPLRTVAKGCLEAALLETRVNSEAPAPGPRIERADISSVSAAPSRPSAPPSAAAAKTDLPAYEPGKSPWWKVIPVPDRKRPMSGPACA